MYRSVVFPGVSGGTKGAISELSVSVDLMKRGFEVYRAMSQASSRDIVAIKDGIFYDIEIRTGIDNVSGKGISYPKKGIRAAYTAVVVYHTGTPLDIYYFPEF